jgi:hypothetical protein
LHAVNFGANEWGDIVYFGLALGEQVWECGIGILAMVIVFEVLQRRISGMDMSVISYRYLG